MHLPSLTTSPQPPPNPFFLSSPMDNPLTSPQPPNLPSPATPGTSSVSNSPEFEFWVRRNPSFPPPNLPSADELFSDGVLLPLHSLNHNTRDPDAISPSDLPALDLEFESGPQISRDPVTHSGSVLSGSRRWKDLFRKSDKKIATAAAEEIREKRDKEKKREKRSQVGPSSAAELNINLWPFSRSRSAGTGGSRPRLSSAASSRKASSAPCSRSNSASESKSRKWPSSPGRPGVHLGRSSPVWQVKRAGPRPKNPNPEPPIRNAEKPEPRRSKPAAGGNIAPGAKPRVLNLNVPTCIGYRNPQFSCRSNENSGARAGGGTLFIIRNLFTKKVY